MLFCFCVGFVIVDCGLIISLSYLVECLWFRKWKCSSTGVLLYFCQVPTNNIGLESLYVLIFQFKFYRKIGKNRWQTVWGGQCGMLEPTVTRQLGKHRDCKCNVLVTYRCVTNQPNTSQPLRCLLSKQTKPWKTENSMCWWGCGETGTLVHCWWKCKMVLLLC